MLGQKGNLKQVGAQTDRDIRILRQDGEFDRYLLALCSLILMVVVFVGAAGYAGIQGLLSPATTAARAPRADHLNRAARYQARLRRPA
jgi:hypothetical protein